MQRQIEYVEPTFHGMNFRDENHVKRAMMAMVSSVSELVEDVNDIMNNPNYIVIDGQSLNNLDLSGWKRGEVRIFGGTWEDAEDLCRREGAVICDGRNGSLEFHDNPDDAQSIQRYFKAAPWGSDAGTTGGSAQHIHGYESPTITGDITVDNHALDHDHSLTSGTATSTTHCHDTSITSSTGSTTITVASGTAVVASACDHTHSVDVFFDDGDHYHSLAGNTGKTQNNAITTVTHTVNNTLDLDGGVVGVGSHDPPHVEIIALMKL